MLGHTPIIFILPSLKTKGLEPNGFKSISQSGVARPHTQTGSGPYFTKPSEWKWMVQILQIFQRRGAGDGGFEDGGQMAMSP